MYVTVTCFIVTKYLFYSTLVPATCDNKVIIRAAQSYDVPCFLDSIWLHNFMMIRTLNYFESALHSSHDVPE